MSLEINPFEIARRTFSEIQNRFPHLKMIVDENEYTEFSVTFPAQPGLDYEVNLNLQNGDELHFSVSNFWLEWFPCTEAKIVDRYIEAVSGFLSGEYRIVEHNLNDICIKSELQSLQWKTVGSYFPTLFSKYFWKRKGIKKRVIRNQKQQ